MVEGGNEEWPVLRLDFEFEISLARRKHPPRTRRAEIKPNRAKLDPARPIKHARVAQF